MAMDTEGTAEQPPEEQAMEVIPEISGATTAGLFFFTLLAELGFGYLAKQICSFGAALVVLSFASSTASLKEVGAHFIYFLVFGIIGCLHITILNYLPFFERKRKVFYTSCVASTFLWLPVACCVYTVPPYTTGIQMFDSSISAFQSSFEFAPAALSMAILFGLAVRGLTAVWFLKTNPTEGGF